MIELEMLEKMFANIWAKTTWNIDGPMLWGYFFFDPRLDRLERAGEYLVSEGYRFVDTHQTEDGAQYVLHVERAETHSTETLYARNAELSGVAERFGLETYDGMDVGPLAS